SLTFTGDFLSCVVTILCSRNQVSGRTSRRRSTKMRWLSGGAREPRSGSSFGTLEPRVRSLTSQSGRSCSRRSRWRRVISPDTPPRFFAARSVIERRVRLGGARASLGVGARGARRARITSASLERPRLAPLLPPLFQLFEQEGEKMENERPLAIITGASTGIGYELAVLAAKGGHDLIIA